MYGTYTEYESMQADDGTGSPWFGQMNYGGRPEDVIFGGDSTHCMSHMAQDYDLTALGIPQPMHWGSESVDMMGWDELGQDDYFGWSPFKAVANAVKKVAAAPKAVVHAATKVAQTALKTAGQVAKKTVGPIAATLAKSPIVKTVAGGAALVFPPVGVPLAAGLATAAAVAAAVHSSVPAQKAAAQQVVMNTHKIATTPGPDQKAAQVSLAAMAMAANTRKAEKAQAAAPAPAAARPAAQPVQPHPTTLWPNPQAMPTQAATAPAIVAQPNAQTLPALAFGARRVSQVWGNRRVTHDISPQGYVATYVTAA